MQTAGVIAVGALAAIIAFQVALALGAPLGGAAWGGRHPGVLPTRLRVASGVAALVVYPLMIAVVLASAGLTTGGRLPGGGALMWALAGFFALGVVANAVSPSRAERWWSPVSLVIAVCCVVIALAGR